MSRWNVNPDVDKWISTVDPKDMLTGKYEDGEQEGVYHSMKDFDNEIEKAIAEGEMNRFDEKVKREYDVIRACKEIWDVVKTTCEGYGVTLDEVGEFFREVQDELCEEMEMEDEDGVSEDECEEECSWPGPCYTVNTVCQDCRNYEAEKKECGCKKRKGHIEKWGEEKG